MGKTAPFRFSFAPLVLAFCLATITSGQTAGSLEFTARIAPTSARPEPVREFTFYILTKSYAQIVKEAEDKDPSPGRDAFIDGLKVSPELRTWLKSYDTMDLSAPDLDNLIAPDEVITVPEFLHAYQRSNSGGVTKGLPQPKYHEADRTEHPEKYEKLKEEYLSALRKFIREHPESASGIELELDGVNPQRKWTALQTEHHKRVEHTAPDLAQLQFLAARADTDLEGRASVSGLAPGDYWISSLNLQASIGDMRVRWDVPVKIQPGRTTRIELSNLNTSEMQTPNTP